MDSRPTHHFINDENASDFQPLAPSWREKRQAFLAQARKAKLLNSRPQDLPVEVLAPANSPPNTVAIDLPIVATPPVADLAISQEFCAVPEEATTPKLPEVVQDHTKTSTLTLHRTEHVILSFADPSASASRAPPPPALENPATTEKPSLQAAASGAEEATPAGAAAAGGGGRGGWLMSFSPPRHTRKIRKPSLSRN